MRRGHARDMVRKGKKKKRNENPKPNTQNHVISFLSLDLSPFSLSSLTHFHSLTLIFSTSSYSSFSHVTPTKSISLLSSAFRPLSWFFTSSLTISFTFFVLCVFHVITVDIGPMWLELPSPNLVTLVDRIQIVKGLLLCRLG